MLLGRSDANGNVKSNFKAHWDLLTTVGSLCIVEQAMEYFGMDSADSAPTKHKPPVDVEQLETADKLDAAITVLTQFLLDKKYVAFDPENPHKAPAHEEPTKLKIDCVLPCGDYAVSPVIEEPNHMANYASQLCHWTLQLLEMQDTSNEGDTDRVMVNAKYNIPLFFSHSKLSKYFVESMDFVLKAGHLSSPQMQTRILEGAFVNKKGGKGNNVEADLVQEHSVRNRKDLVRGLGANKNTKAIARVTSAADHVSAISRAFNGTFSLKTSGGRHTKRVSEKDIQSVKSVFREVRPFKHQPGRPCKGFKNIVPDPTMRINMTDFDRFLKNNTKRICEGLPIEVEEDDLIVV